MCLQNTHGKKNDNLYHDEDDKLYRQIVSTRKNTVLCFITKKNLTKKQYSLRPAEAVCSLAKMCMHLICKYVTRHPSRHRSSCRQCPCNMVVVLITKISTYLANAHVCVYRTQLPYIVCRQTMPDLNLLFIQ